MIHRTSSMVTLCGLALGAWAGVASGQQREAGNLTPLPFPEIDTPSLPEPGMSWWLLLGGALVMALLVGLLVAILVRGRVARPPTPPPHPLRRAIQRLEVLQGHLDTLSPAEVGHEVSVVLREYQQDRYRVPAPYLTTEELYEGGALDAREEVRGRFNPLAQVYDRLAFGRVPATKAEGSSLISDAITALQEERVYLPGSGGLPEPLPLPPQAPPAPLKAENHQKAEV